VQLSDCYLWLESLWPQGRTVCSLVEAVDTRVSQAKHLSEHEKRKYLSGRVVTVRVVGNAGTCVFRVRETATGAPLLNEVRKTFPTADLVVSGTCTR